MEKTEKELAFLRGIYVEPEFTAKFTELFNEGVVVEGVSTITYLNAGAGGHAIEIGDKLGADVEVFPVCEDAELVEIARTKAETVRSGVDFSTEAPMAQSDLVIADASLTVPEDVKSFLSRSAACCSGKLAFFLPTAGSFGEVFSYVWEVLSESEDPAASATVESLISGLRTVSEAEELALELKLSKVQSVTKNEILEFEDGKAFVEAPLVRHFLLPGWLGSVPEAKRNEVVQALARKIDEESDGMTFTFALKATVVWGEKIG